MPQNWCYCHFHFDPFRAVKILYSYISSSSFFSSLLWLCVLLVLEIDFHLDFIVVKISGKWVWYRCRLEGNPKTTKTVGAPSVRSQQVGVTHTHSHRERIEQFVWERDRDSWSCYPGLWVNLSGRDLSARALAYGQGGRGKKGRVLTHMPIAFLLRIVVYLQLCSYRCVKLLHWRRKRKRYAVAVVADVAAAAISV